MKWLLTFSGTQPTTDATLKFNLTSIPMLNTLKDKWRYLHVYDTSGTPLPCWLQHRLDTLTGNIYVKLENVSDIIHIVVAIEPEEGCNDIKNVGVFGVDFDDPSDINSLNIYKDDSVTYNLSVSNSVLNFSATTSATTYGRGLAFYPSVVVSPPFVIEEMVAYQVFGYHTAWGAEPYTTSGESFYPYRVSDEILTWLRQGAYTIGIVKKLSGVDRVWVLENIFSFSDQDFQNLHLISSEYYADGTVVFFDEWHAIYATATVTELTSKQYYPFAWFGVGLDATRWGQLDWFIVYRPLTPFPRLESVRPIFAERKYVYLLTSEIVKELFGSVAIIATGGSKSVLETSRIGRDEFSGASLHLTSSALQDVNAPSVIADVNATATKINERVSNSYRVLQTISKDIHAVAHEASPIALQASAGNGMDLLHPENMMVSTLTSDGAFGGLRISKQRETNAISVLQTAVANFQTVISHNAAGCFATIRNAQNNTVTLQRLQNFNIATQISKLLEIVTLASRIVEGVVTGFKMNSVTTSSRKVRDDILIADADGWSNIREISTCVSATRLGAAEAFVDEIVGSRTTRDISTSLKNANARLKAFIERVASGELRFDYLTSDSFSGHAKTSAPFTAELITALRDYTQAVQKLITTLEASASVGSATQIGDTGKLVVAVVDKITRRLLAILKTMIREID